MTKIASAENLGDPLTNTLTIKIFESHVQVLDLGCNRSWLQDKWEIVGFKSVAFKSLSDICLLFIIMLSFTLHILFLAFINRCMRYHQGP